MRSCEDMELLINLCLDDMLPSEQLEELQAHLEVCPVCREKFAQMREMKAALADMEVPVPEDLHERIMAYVAENTTETVAETTAPAKILRPRRWYRGLATVAACAVIAVAASRFVPNLKNDTAENLVAAPQAPGVAFDMPATESVQDADSAVPEDMPAEQPAVSATPESGNMPIPSEPAMTDEKTGQMAEDLPPLRQDNDSNAAKTEASICKWLKAEGPQDKLPEWVDSQFVYETQLDGQTVSYVEVAVWAEDYWTDQLQACGFTVEDMEGENLTENGECLLIFFFWTT